MTDEPMTDEPMYDEWIAHRRAAQPSGGFTDRVMASVEGQTVNRRRCSRVAERMNESLMARLAACLTAMMVGGLPFLYAAYVAQLLVY